MMNPLISVIIPVYNVEQYLGECLDSVLAQTYENLEIIVVDDGSTDSSGIICDDYAGRDKRIKVIHNTNGGPSDARNCGILNSSGDYLLFLDSDDTLATSMSVQEIVDKVYESSADVIIGHFIGRLEGNISPITDHAAEDIVIEQLGRDAFFLSWPTLAIFRPPVCTLLEDHIY